MLDDDVLENVLARLTRILGAPARAYQPFIVENRSVGWLTDERVSRLSSFDDVFRVGAGAIRLHATLDNPRTRSAALARVTRQLAQDRALSAWRNEMYAVRMAEADEPIFEIERAAARYFGIRTYAAHINGLVPAAGDTSMWIARRSRDKAIDPGKLDNLVGGGVAAGTTIAATVVKEAWEEAGIPAALARRAKPVATLHVRRDQPDGLQDEEIFVHDLWLPASFVPTNHDGEVIGHRLVDLSEAGRLISNVDGPDEVTADASLVILDAMLRHGAIPPHSPFSEQLARFCEPSRA